MVPRWLRRSRSCSVNNRPGSPRPNVRRARITQWTRPRNHIRGLVCKAVVTPEFRSPEPAWIVSVGRSPESVPVRVLPGNALLHVECDPVVVLPVDEKFACQPAPADVYVAQFARVIGPPVADVDFVVVGVPLDVERVEVTPRVGVAELVGAEAVRPEIDIAFQGDAPVLVESQSPAQTLPERVSYSSSSSLSQPVKATAAHRSSAARKNLFIYGVLRIVGCKGMFFFAYCENPAYLCSPVCQAGKCGKI